MNPNEDLILDASDQIAGGNAQRPTSFLSASISGRDPGGGWFLPKPHLPRALRRRDLDVTWVPGGGSVPDDLAVDDDEDADDPRARPPPVALPADSPARPTFSCARDRSVFPIRRDGRGSVESSRRRRR